MSFLAACSGNDEPETPRQTPCERLRDHVIDLRLALEKNIDVEAHRAVMREALGNDFLESCATKMSDDEVSCALEATDSDAVVACSTTSSTH